VGPTIEGGEDVTRISENSSEKLGKGIYGSSTEFLDKTKEERAKKTTKGKLDQQDEKKLMEGNRGCTEKKKKKDRKVR